MNPAEVRPLSLIPAGGVSTGRGIVAEPSSGTMSTMATLELTSAAAAVASNTRFHVIRSFRCICDPSSVVVLYGYGGSAEPWLVGLRATKGRLNCAKSRS